MTAADQPGTATPNGRLWGAHARDWADIQEGQFRVAYDHVFSHLGLAAGARYCDVGCGSGMAVQMAALRGAQVSGMDAAENLLDVARARVPAAQLHCGEMEQLPFADASFDLVTGFNSFQFAANPGAALAEAGRITKPTGHVVVMTWGTPAGMEAASLIAALKPLLPPAPPGAPGPFALSEEVALRAFASAAGLRPLAVHDVACVWAYPDLVTALRGLRSSGVSQRAVENSSEADVAQANTAALTPFRQADGSYRIGAAFRWLLAGV